MTAAVVLSTFGAVAQNKNHKLGVEAGTYLSHYNGNLGNSFFKFKTTAFGGFSANAGLYLNNVRNLPTKSCFGLTNHCS